jgi:hypothetical protein
LINILGAGEFAHLIVRLEADKSHQQHQGDLSLAADSFGRHTFLDEHVLAYCLLIVALML